MMADATAVTPEPGFLAGFGCSRLLLAALSRSCATGPSAAARTTENSPESNPPTPARSRFLRRDALVCASLPLFVARLVTPIGDQAALRGIRQITSVLSGFPG